MTGSIDIETFYKLFKKATFEKEELIALQKISQQFPAFSFAHFLDAKIHHSINSIDVSQKTSKASVYSQNRSKLSDYILNPFFEEKIIEEKTLEVEPVTQPQEEKQVKTKEENEDTSMQQQIITHAIDYSIQMDIDEISEELEHESEKTVNKQINIIDQFLNREVGIKPIKNYESKPADNVKTSIQDKGDMVTETLARIYIHQGAIDKAIGVYHQLLLKYPEKKGYFASQIEILKKTKK